MQEIITVTQVNKRNNSGKTGKPYNYLLAKTTKTVAPTHLDQLTSHVDYITNLENSVEKKTGCATHTHR